MKQKDLLTGSIPMHIFRLACPSILGMLSFTIFNLTDTYFVSQLGTKALAAMGFTFPVVMIVAAISSGMSTGAASLISRAKGANDNYLMQRVATDGILLSLIFVMCISFIGIISMDKVFTLLGVDPDTLPLVKEYMLVWYSYVVVVVTPPICDSSMRATGDMIGPLIVMVVCATINIILDPLLIHGYWIFPRLGMKGAALATVISRAIGMIVTLSLLHFKHHLLSFKFKDRKEIIESWKSILKIGVPSIAVLLMPQLLRSVLTILVSSSGGTQAVAAIAVGTRVESFIRIITAGVGMALIPIIGHNWGAKQYDRVYKTRKIAIKFALIYGIIVFALAIPLAKPISRIFTSDEEVILYSAYYLWIMIFGMIGLNITDWMSRAFTTIGRPMWTVALNVLGILFIVLPLAILGKMIYSYIGILLGICIGQILLGIGAIILAKNKMIPE